VRALYRINDNIERLPVFSGQFGVPGTDLVGFSPSPSNFAIDWAYFFGRGPSDTKAQASYIDRRIVDEFTQPAAPARVLRGSR